ncbi:MAG: HNH endonuclease signature motif containing protein [Candidatus Bipolaricaulis sp.]|jgi:hypothetical protein|nr:HNH endonuclease signature motif containing protein [Candidatus Bipolaricaulis sp.]
MIKPIPEFPNYYITDDGVVISVKPNNQYSKRPGTLIILKHRNNRGYPTVALSKNNRQYNRRVHRLVMETFVGLRPTGLEICHNDGNKLNNKIENLRYDTHKNNMKDRTVQCRGFIPAGALNGQSKLNELQVRIVRRFCALNLMGNQKYIANIFGVHRTTICNIARNLTWQVLFN